MAAFELDFALRQGGFLVELAQRVEARALALFGPSGSGKTTIVEAIAGLRTPASGRISVAGQLMFSRAEHVDVPSRLRRAGYVPQDVLLFPHLDVRRNVLYGRRPGATQDLDMLARLLDIEDLLDRRVTSLSGGERQRVALGRALMTEPRVLLLDEPLAAVDLPRRRRILETLLRIRDELRVPIVYVAHAPEEVTAIADHVVVLDAGRVVAAGSPQACLE